MTQPFTPGMQLAQELAQAIVTNDDTAAKVAAVNIVGMWLDTQLRQAAALEKIAGCVDGFGQATFVVSGR